MADRKSLEKAIAREEALLSKLEKIREQALSRIQEYKCEISSIEASCCESQIPYLPRSSQQKVTLFRSLFRGREDLFPRFWTSRAGKKGYSPACTNDWASGVCGKTRKPPIKCNECDNRKFVAMIQSLVRKDEVNDRIDRFCLQLPLLDNLGIAQFYGLA